MNYETPDFLLPEPPSDRQPDRVILAGLDRAGPADCRAGVEGVKR